MTDRNEGLLLKRRVLEAVLQQYGPLEAVRARLLSGGPEWRDELLRALGGAFGRARREYGFPERDTLFGLRVQQLALEDLRGEPAHPPIVPLPEPMPDEVREVLRPGASNHVVLIEHLSNAGNEAYPLMVDAMAHGRVPRNVLCVHTDWLDGEFRVHRAIAPNFVRDELVETPLPGGVRADGVHCLCISPASHRYWSSRAKAAGVFEANAFEASDAADDKWGCYRRWAKEGVPTPRSALIESSAGSNARRKLVEAFLDGLGESAAGVAVQPNRGTESRGVRVFPDDPTPDGVLEAVEAICRDDDCLLREYIGQPGPPGHTVMDLRINAGYGGRRFSAESGYCMTAAAGECVSSPERGGRIVSWAAARTVMPEAYADESSLRLAMETAERAAAALEPVGLTGIDIRLSLGGNGRVVPWVLDANPRPSGLTHSRYFADGEPGVTAALWRWLDTGAKA